MYLPPSTNAVGNDALELSELAARIGCQKLDALRCLCDTLVEGNVFEYSKGKYSLGNTGGILQQEMDDTFSGGIRTIMENQHVWDKFGLLLLDKLDESDTVNPTDAAKNLCSVAMGHSDASDLVELLDGQEMTNLEEHSIGYIGSEDLSATIQILSS